MADNPKFIIPEYKIDENEEFIEDSRHELPVQVYGEEIPDIAIQQFDDSYYKEEVGWKIIRNKAAKGTGVIAVFLVISVVGAKHFRNKYGEEK
jgi:hypothetical protein